MKIGIPCEYRSGLCFILLLLSLFFGACQKIKLSGSKGELLFIGSENKKAILYKVLNSTSEKKTYYPLMVMTTNTKLSLNQGKYFIANECSSYEFECNGKDSTKVVMSQVNFHFNGDKKDKDNDQHPRLNVFKSLCLDPIDGKEHWYENRDTFNVLPGESTISVNGKRISTKFVDDYFTEHNVELWPLSLTSPLNNNGTNQFFSLPLDLSGSEKKYVISAPLNGILWLQKGKYQIEVNGSRKIVEMNDSLPKEIKLGVLRISSPKYFPYEDRIKLGGQPIFAFINEKVLFSLDTDYPVFAGNYKISLESSEIEKDIEIELDKISIVKTVGSIVYSPKCQKRPNEKCPFFVRVTIHSNKMPFVLLNVAADMPFLVFDQKYEFGVEGMKGVFKNLNTSQDSVGINKLGRVKIRWETRYSAGNIKTDFVRFEARNQSVSGKSLDLMFFKPDEVFLPEGEYILTYFVGDQSAVLPKVSLDIPLMDGITKEVSVPYYTLYKEQPVEKTLEDTTAVPNTTLLPIQN